MHALDVGLAVLCTLATSIWVGGIVTIAVVAQVGRRTLSPSDSVAFFRRLGRTHGIIGSGALVVALITGGALLRHHGWDAALISSLVVAVVLIAVSVIGILQARQMTVLRQASLNAGSASAAIARGARRAVVLRGLIGVFTLALIVLGSVMAT